MSLVDQKMERASSDLEAAFEKIPTPVLSDSVQTRPAPSNDLRGAVLAIAIFAVVAVSISLLAPGATPASEEVTPPTQEVPPPTEEEPPPTTVPAPLTFSYTVTPLDDHFLPVLAGGEIFGLGRGVWLPDGNGSWDLADIEVVGETREGWINNFDLVGDTYIGIYRTLGDEENNPSDFLVYSDDAVTWHHADVVDNRSQPRWLFAAGTDRVLALAKTDPPPDMVWNRESVMAWSYEWEVWSSRDGRAWELATTLDLVSMNPEDIVHRDGRFYITGRYDGDFDGVQPEPYLWTSTDGVDWQAIPVPTTGSPGNGAYEMETINSVLVITTLEEAYGVWALSGGEWTDVTPTGFYGASLVPQADPAGPLFLVDRTDIWWTLDGFTWSHTTIEGGVFGPTGGPSPAVAVGQTVVAMQTSGGAPARAYSIWTGTLD